MSTSPLYKANTFVRVYCLVSLLFVYEFYTNVIRNSYIPSLSRGRLYIYNREEGRGLAKQDFSRYICPYEALRRLLQDTYILVATYYK